MNLTRGRGEAAVPLFGRAAASGPGEPVDRELVDRKPVDGPPVDRAVVDPAVVDPAVVDPADFAAARGPALLRLAWLLTADADLAQDLVQDTFARVLPNWARVCAGGDPEPYVRAALRSAWTDSWRRRRVRPDEVPVDPPERVGPDRGVEGTAVRLDLAQALGRLTPRQRAVLVLRFYEDLTETQAARVLGCSVSTVKSQARHALRRLREVAPELVLPGAEEATR